MIFIEINVDKIINAFTKNFFVNVVNVYHIYVKDCLNTVSELICLFIHLAAKANRANVAVRLLI